jgi:hypothetical protein
MVQNQKDGQHSSYDHKFKEVFYIGILDNNDVVKSLQKYEKIRELREYIRTLLDGNEECIKKANKVIKSKEIKDTRKIFLVECQEIRILIAMRLDVMIKPFEYMKKIDMSKIEKVE